MKYKLIPFLLLLIPFIANAQSQTTDIWLMDLTMKEGKPTAGALERITENDYYDNQPCFSKDGTLLYYVSMADTTQSDIFEYNLKRKIFRQVTNTPESEFQPQPVPYDKYKLSVVRVDDDKAQRFYIMTFDGAEPEQAMNNQDSVAYYTWMNDTTVGLYLLNGAGGSLQQFDMKVQQSIILMEGNFGRCLARIPGSDDLSYVQKSSDGKYILIRYQIEGEQRTPVGILMDSIEDYCWGADGKIYSGNKGILYFYDTKSDNPVWTQVADLTKTVGTFYRLAMNPKGDKIALVSYRGERP